MGFIGEFGRGKEQEADLSVSDTKICWADAFRQSYRLGDSGVEAGWDQRAHANFSAAMPTEKLINYFLPAGMRNNRAHPRYHEFYTIASPILAGVIFLAFCPLLLYALKVGGHLWLYFLSSGVNFLTLLSMRWLGHYRFFNILSALVNYGIIYTWLHDKGLIYSANMCIVHMFLLGSVLTDKKWGWLGIITNIVFIAFVFSQTEQSSLPGAFSHILGSPTYALAIHILITVFLGGFLASTMRIQEVNRRKINLLQNEKIGMLDEAVRERTQQLNDIRQTIATDFHDQTGNMLAAINRQASTLEIKLQGYPKLLSIVKSIIENSNDLYASSKDFVWNLNHDSENPITLFNYLTAHGQNFYNQFDISFSAELNSGYEIEKQLDPFAALNIIYIFKEAMSNVVKHSGADEVIMSMALESDKVKYSLTDNGQWKDPDLAINHFGLQNMERRCRQSGFNFEIKRNTSGTVVTIRIPLKSYFFRAIPFQEKNAKNHHYRRQS